MREIGFCPSGALTNQTMSAKIPFPAYFFQTADLPAERVEYRQPATRHGGFFQGEKKRAVSRPGGRFAGIRFSVLRTFVSFEKIEIGRASKLVRVKKISGTGNSYLLPQFDHLPFRQHRFRQCKMECRALPLNGLNPNLAAVDFHNFFAGRQTNTGAFKLLFGVEAPENLKNARLIFERDTDAVVGNGKAVKLVLFGT